MPAATAPSIDQRDDGAKEPHVPAWSAAVRPGAPTPGRVAVALAPSATFLAAHHWGGLVPAIAAASLTSAVAIVLRRRQGAPLGILLPASLAYVLLRAVAGILTGSDAVYFGLGLALSATAAIAVAATVFTAMPMAAHVLPMVVRYSTRTTAHPLYRRVAAQTTVAWAAAELAVTVWEATHLTTMAAPDFVLLRTFGGWPIMAAWICVLIFYVRLRLDPLEFGARTEQTR